MLTTVFKHGMGCLCCGSELFCRPTFSIARLLLYITAASSNIGLGTNTAVVIPVSLLPLLKLELANLRVMINSKSCLRLDLSSPIMSASWLRLLLLRGLLDSPLHLRRSILRPGPHPQRYLRSGTRPCFNINARSRLNEGLRQTEVQGRLEDSGHACVTRRPILSGRKRSHQYTHSARHEKHRDEGSLWVRKYLLKIGVCLTQQRIQVCFARHIGHHSVYLTLPSTKAQAERTR